ncbi:hypothetical protein QKU48_gp0816 [Fadolivirus algeromassiliense]|jgi:hypothetical protein|uniref:Uncharacterized protein n=1 Tax=Fadolivirus FV1/VV64 TaxID=3070911 RepID=A0A7D3UVS0_9VIRU|nr:hypothetical protein QKU48_gp0816 [Fadolivirus algeromassiliense]QKF94274.1 hypothetical protein Fadolivirus_1_816 [Fadolivirus FV1/VV64]
MAHKCDNCDHCKILKKKLEIYEKCMKDLRELENNDNDRETFIDLEASIIITKDNDGNQVKKIKSELSESILVIDKGKDLNELSKKEQAIIQEQDNYRAYTQTKNATDKLGTVYSVCYYAVSIGKMIMFL